MKNEEHLEGETGLLSFIREVILELLFENIDVFISALRFCTAFHIGVIHIKYVCVYFFSPPMNLFHTALLILSMPEDLFQLVGVLNNSI